MWSATKHGTWGDGKVGLQKTVSNDSNFRGQFTLIVFFNSKDYGKKTNSSLTIIGINHAELNSNGVIKEWVLFDEVAIWKQILMNKNKNG